MGWRARAVGVAVLLTGVSGCLASDGDEALRLTRSACEWYRNAPAPTETATAETVNEMADSMDPWVGRVALAARKDARWDRMSNAWTDLQSAIRQAAIARDGGAAAESASNEVRRLNVPELQRTITQECRKAEAG